LIDQKGFHLRRGRGIGGHQSRRQVE
jgi:hypothetical protein